MRLFRTRFHAYVALVFLGCVVIAGIVIMLLARERVTEANFVKVTLGMSEADVRRLLGPPDFEPGCRPALYDAAELYDAADFHFATGYRYYTRQQWSSPEITIALCSDPDDRVAHRYRGEGQRRPTVFEIEYLSPHPRGQRWHGIGVGISQEADGAIGEEPVRSPGMLAGRLEAGGCSVAVSPLRMEMLHGPLAPDIRDAWTAFRESPPPAGRGGRLALGSARANVRSAHDGSSFSFSSSALAATSVVPAVNLIPWASAF
jgi:hypothetical protein